MLTFKKILFVVPFLLFLSLAFWQFSEVLKNPNIILSLDLSVLSTLIYLLITTLLAALFFIVFATLSADWRFVLPVAVLASLTPLAILPAPQNLICFVGTFLILSGVFLSFSRQLLSYLDFKPAALLAPSIKQTATLLFLVFSISYFLSSQSLITAQGFEIPDSLIDQALKFVPQDQQTTQVSEPTQPILSPDQIKLLKQNPDLLKARGIDPSILDTINSTTPSTPTTAALVKPLVKSQIQSMINPYLSFIPAILSILFFFTLQSLAAIAELFLSPAIWLTFKLLETSGFTKYVTETRQVKKLTL